MSDATSCVSGSGATPRVVVELSSIETLQHARTHNAPDLFLLTRMGSNGASRFVELEHGRELLVTSAPGGVGFRGGGQRREDHTHA